MHMYDLYGLTVASDIALGIPGEEADADITLRRLASEAAASDDPPAGETVAQLVIGDRRFYTAVAVPEGYVLRIHGVCDFVMNAPVRSVECHAPETADAEFLSLLVRGALAAFVLGLRGACVLHASAVETDAGTVVFVGASGMGKSTMAALACRDGARFVCDDLLRLGDGPEPTWVGRSSELRLRPAASGLVQDEMEAWGARQTVDDRVALSPPAALSSSGRIGAVVMPSPSREQPELELTRIDPFEATFVLSAFPRLVWTAPEPLAAQFAGVAHLADAVPTYQAVVPWGPPFEAGLGTRVLEVALT